MDFTGRSAQPSGTANSGPQFSGNAGGAGNKKTKVSRQSKLIKWGTGLLGLLVVALLVAALLTVVLGNKTESQFVDKNKLQAVFLQTGQVYFGNVTTLNSKYFVVKNIYYLQTSQTGTNTSASNANTNVSLVKLGCELHAPYDQMVINRDQVTFWENLQDDGQVAKAVSTFEKDNPNGQKCADQSKAPNSNSNVQSTGTTNNGSSTTNTGTNKQ